MKHIDLVYDVGMHKGEDAEFCIRKGFRVIGVGADPDLVRAYREPLADFIAQRQLTTVAGAIVDPKHTEPTVRFVKNSERSVWKTVLYTWANRNGRLGSASTGTIEVAAIDFCQMIRQYGVPYYLRVDIEGCNMFCIASELRRSSRLRIARVGQTAVLEYPPSGRRARRPRLRLVSRSPAIGAPSRLRFRRTKGATCCVEAPNPRTVSCYSSGL